MRKLARFAWRVLKTNVLAALGMFVAGGGCLLIDDMIGVKSHPVAILLLVGFSGWCAAIWPTTDTDNPSPTDGRTTK